MACKRMLAEEGQHRRVWDGLHVSPRTAPSKGAKLCTCFAWFFRPGQLRTEPYFDIPMPVSRLNLLMQIRVGSHSLPVEQGRLARPMIPRPLHQCRLCDAHARGAERHYVFDCLHFAHIRRQFRSLFQVADGVMQSFMWHRKKAVADLPFSLWQMTEKEPVLVSQCWLNGKLEFSLSLSLSQKQNSVSWGFQSQASGLATHH